MASYKTHISVGAILGAIIIVCSIVFLAVFELQLFIFMFLAVILGSFLPDIDSDSGVPFQLLFGLLGLSGSAFVLYLVLLNGKNDIRWIIGAPLAGFLVIRLIVGEVFKRYTRHRGIMHSVPMAIVVSLLGLVLLNLTTLGSGEKILISFSLGVGFLSHLILDEIFATINIHGKHFRPSPSLGSALKLWSHSLAMTVFVYGLGAYLFIEAISGI